VATLRGCRDDVLLHDGLRAGDRTLATALTGADAVVTLAERPAGDGKHVATVIDALGGVPPQDRPLVLVNLSRKGERHGGEAEREALRARALGVRFVLLRIGGMLRPPAPALSPQRDGSGSVGRVELDDVIGFTLHALRAWDVAGPVDVVAPGPVEQGILGAAARSGYRFGCGSVRDAACSNASGP
jgi:hypothetical protein